MIFTGPRTRQPAVPRAWACAASLHRRSPPRELLWCRIILSLLSLLRSFESALFTFLPTFVSSPAPPSPGNRFEVSESFSLSNGSDKSRSRKLINHSRAKRDSFFSFFFFHFGKQKGETHLNQTVLGTWSDRRTLSCLAVRPLSLLLFGKKLRDDLSFGINHSVPELSPHPLRFPLPPSPHQNLAGEDFGMACCPCCRRKH